MGELESSYISKGLKVKIIERLECEHAYFVSAVQRYNYSIHADSPRGVFLNQIRIASYNLGYASCKNFEAVKPDELGHVFHALLNNLARFYHLSFIWT